MHKNTIVNSFVMKIRLVELNSIIIKSVDQSIEKVSEGYEFYLFKGDALLTRSDQLFEAKHGDCILFSANEDINIKSTDSGLEVLYLSFKSADCSKFLSSLDFPTNSLQTPIQTYFIENITDKIAKESAFKDLYYENIISILVQELLIKVSRFVKQDFVLSLPDHAQKLRELRTEVHENFPKRWTIDNMANIMGLSSSRFASLYKQIFKISPTEDLIKTRIAQSKKMLSSTKVSIKKVSVACGFESVHYFHRAFKKRIGMTPKHFQNKMLSDQGSIPTEQSQQSLDTLSLNSDFSGTLEVIDGEIVFNGSDSNWSHFLGYSSNDIRNKPFMNLISDDDLSKAKDAMDSIINGKNIFHIILSLISKDGSSIPIDFSAVSRGNSTFWFVKKQLVISS